MKRIKALTISLMIVSTLFTGCGNQSSYDEMGAYFFDEDAMSYMNMTLEEINEKTGNGFDKEDAYEVDDDEITFDLGEVSSLFSGNLDLGGSFPVKLTLGFDESKLCEIEYCIGDDETSGNVNDVADDILENIKSNVLPEYEYRWSDATGNVFENEKNKMMIYNAVRIEDFQTTFPIYISIVEFS